MEFGTGSMTISGTSGTSATRNKTTVPSGAKFSILVNAIDAGNYKLYLNKKGTNSTNVKYSVGDAEATVAEIPAAEGYAELGVASLAQGLNTINIENTGSAEITVTHLKLEYTNDKIYAANEIGSASKEFVFRTNGVNDIGVTDATSCVLYNASVSLSGKDNYIEYTVVADLEGNYNVQLSCDAPNNDVRIQVLVNDSDQIEYVTIRGDKSSRSYVDMGTIHLTAGENKIKFKNVTTAAGVVNSAMDKFKLISVDETTSPIELATNKWTITQDNVDTKFRTEVNVTSDDSFEYKVVNGGEAADYKLYMYYASSNGKAITVDTSVDDVTAITGAPLPKTATTTDLEWAQLGVVSLAKGVNTLKFEFSNGDLTKIKKIKLVIDEGSQSVNMDINTTTSVETKYEAPVSGWYGVTLNAANTVDLTVKVSHGMQELTKAIAADGTNYIGKLYLTEGENTITLTAASGSATVKGLSLGDMQEEISLTSLELDINPKTVGYTTNYEENDTALSSANSIDLRVGGENSNPDTSFTVGIYTDKALSYNLTASLSVPYEAMGINVTVNGEKQISGKALPTESSLTDRTLGVITLNRGINELTFDADGKDADTAQDGIAQHLTVAGIKLDTCNSFAEYEYKKALVPGNTADEYFKEGDGYTEDYASLSTGSWIEYDVYSPVDRIVSVSLNASCLNASTFTISLNGSTVKTGTIAASDGYVNVAAGDTFSLPAGKSTIRYIQNSGTINVKEISVQDADIDEISVVSFEVQNASGYVTPYVVTDDLDIYAVAELKKLGSMVDDKVMLIVAQYSENELVDCTVENIDFSQIEKYVTNEYKAKLTLKGNSGTVKAFLMKSDNLTPMVQNIAYTEVQLISQQTLDALFNEEVTYDIAENVEQSAGVNYGNYHYNTSNGTVQAIFYDSIVENNDNQTKVFAYMGVPAKDANGNLVSESNPVPAVVLLHGGECKVDKTWVAKWVQKGYAAIAMDLYGRGPDQEYHQYKGIEPWGGTMWKGIETAGMYQNTLNIIRAHNLIMSMPGVDESKTALVGLSMGGITTATAIGFDTRFDVAVPIYGATVTDVNAYPTPQWDPRIQAAKANIPVMLLAGAGDTNFSIEDYTKTVDVFKNGCLSVYQQLPHSDIAREFEQVYNYVINNFNGIDPYVKITGESLNGNEFSIDVEIPDGTSVNKVITYYTTTDKIIKGNNNWQAIESSIDANGKVAEDIPEGATYAYASVHFTYEGNTFTGDNYSDDLILTSKLVKIK